MDDQHAILLDAVNDLRRAVMGGSSRAQIRPLLEHVVQFTLLHFASEERLMAQWSFPGLVDHREEHQRLLARIGSAALRFESERGFAIVPALAPLCKSFLDHIRESDRQYGEWLSERNLR